MVVTSSCSFCTCTNIYIKEHGQNTKCTKFVTTYKGVQQGDILSLLLFSTDHRKKHQTLHDGVNHLTALVIKEFLYADELLTTATSVKDLQGAIVIWHKTIQEFGMKINFNK